MKRLALLTLLCLAAPLWAAPPTLKIPAEIKATGDYVTFTPETDAKAVTYVSQSGVDAFPSELLKDPRSFVLPVRGLPPARYQFTAVGTLNDEQARQTFVVVVGTPAPPVPPGPQPPNPDDPTPDPFGGAQSAAPAFRCLIVYESADLSKLPPAQLTAITSAQVRDYLNTHCAVGPDGKTREWRVWDSDTNVSAESPLWQKMMAKKRTKLPWLYLGNGTKGYDGPFPENTDRLMAILKKYGGN
jgi:hypothetical protein